MSPARPASRWLAASALLGLALVLVATLFRPTAEAQVPGLRLPAQAGTVWEVLAGYNTATHESVDAYALDLWRVDGPTGGSLLLAPMDGRIGYLSDDCISVRNDLVDVLLCHVFPVPGLEDGDPVVLGQLLGTVAPDGQANNNGIAHIHLQLNLENHAPGAGASLPFTGSFALEGQEFPETADANAHYGSRVTSTNVIQGGAPAPAPTAAAPPTVLAGPDVTAAPGELVTLTADATSATTVRWQQVAGGTVLPGSITGNQLTFTAPSAEASPLRFLVSAEGPGGVASAQVRVDVVAPAPPSRGRIVSGEPAAAGVNLVVFGGGPVDELMTTLSCDGALSVWASGLEGGFIRYAHDSPAFVNAAWDARFPEGLPELTPLLISCGPA